MELLVGTRLIGRLVVAEVDSIDARLSWPLFSRSASCLFLRLSAWLWASCLDRFDFELEGPRLLVAELNAEPGYAGRIEPPVGQLASPVSGHELLQGQANINPLAGYGWERLAERGFARSTSCVEVEIIRPAIAPQV